MKIDFNKRVETVEVANKKYEVCISNYDFIKKCQANLANIEMAQKKLNESGTIDDLLEASKEFVNLVLDGDFDRIWEACYKDIFNLLDLCGAISQIVKKGFEYKANKYV